MESNSHAIRSRWMRTQKQFHFSHSQLEIKNPFCCTKNRYIALRIGNWLPKLHSFEFQIKCIVYWLTFCYCISITLDQFSWKPMKEHRNCINFCHICRKLSRGTSRMESSYATTSIMDWINFHWINACIFQVPFETVHLKQAHQQLNLKNAQVFPLFINGKIWKAFPPKH